ncbi:RHS repeat-associated core domain-containing protein [Actinacidiphila sp. DG2A-62]|uniref:RHS repeat-associated core domain-containing protein n=1 Tax=Actinacidiphila sp. DG2A-62 TaxID=3108821 RepID=UPI002DBC974B|nr:RHS repeat-associated core domain-containing protein [Actinacidiphila sp. DG2A-62]MEC3996358.1 RHS repeat-associated core domain-containing protein [Actinacidiphila sp. DG2A-62]
MSAFHSAKGSSRVDVTTQGVVLAADVTPSGGGGTYAATSLNPSTAWTAGSSSGGFTYSYPIQAPPAIGSDTPQVALSYDSSSVDGLTSSTNSQASWIGDGWTYEPGFVELHYKSCDKDGLDHSGDVCWGGYDAQLSMGGTSSDLVRDDTSGAWRLKNDDGSVVEFLTGANNGTATGQYVKISTSSGSVYYFGLNHLPGGDNSDPASNSAWSEPVYSPKSNDPCYDSSKGTASWCQMPWRLNLDYAVDPHGNLTTYTYNRETNYYERGAGQNSGVGTLTAYTRAGALASINYGQRLADQVTAHGALKPAAKIVFTPAPEGRCSTDGGFTCSGAKLSTANASHWPDVPYDQNCGSSGTCNNASPTFWSNTRLKTITTQILSNGVYQDVDKYDLTQSYPDPRDGNKPTLWLSSITRTGEDGSPAVSLPPVTFTPTEMPNRVDGTDLVPAPTIFERPRIQQVTTETGEQINVDYRLPACSRVNHVMPASAATDTMACYNVKWYPPGTVDGAPPASDWFNRYQVDSVTQNDPVAHSKSVVTHYDYGPAAWHYDDDELTDAETRTWDDFRGYASVTTVTGSGEDGPKSQTVTKYLQGMDQDKAASGTRSVTIGDRLGESVTDSDWLAGQVLETDTYDKADGSVTSYTVHRSIGQSTTAIHVRGSGLPDLVAGYAATQTVSTSKALKADGSWRTTTTTTVSDPDHANRAETVDTLASGLPETCVRTSYATGANPLMSGLADQAITVSGNNACTATATKTNTVSGSRTLYDSKTFGDAGIAGNVTAAQVLDHYDSSGNAVYVTTKTNSYDVYGRIVSTTDPNATDSEHAGGATTSTSYTPAQTGELPKTVTVTSPAPGSATGWTTTVTYDPARGLELSSTDLNAETTNEGYDALGRLTKVWYPGRTTSQNPNLVYAYALNGSGAPSAVTTSTLMSDTPLYNVSVQIYDGFGRALQTQSTPGISAYHGRVLENTNFYDSQGRLRETQSPRYDDGSAPNATPSMLPDDEVAGQQTILYDGQGRTTASVFSSFAVEQWRTTTAYPGVDETDVSPPAGGTPTTTITDSLGRTSQLWQYRTSTPTGQAADADVTTYTYTPDGNPSTRTDSTAKDTWTYGYDLRGRQITAGDPDTGTTIQTYDADGRLATVTDARKVTLSYDYDLIGRKTAEHSVTAPSTTPKLEAAWTYDSIKGDLGQPVASTRYVDGDAAKAYTSAIGSYDVGYRPTKVTLTLPTSEKALAGPFVTQSVYNPITGALKATHTDQRGDLAAETVNYTYDVNGALLSYGSAGTEYDLSTDYDAFGRPIRTTVNPWGTEIVATDNYDNATGSLLSSYLDKQTSATGAVQQTTYLRDDAGRLTGIQNIADNNPSQTDLQCFSYDYLGRLTTAWTDTGGISTQPQPKVPNVGGCKNSSPTTGAAAGGTTVGGPAAYWTSYAYDTRGNRTGLTQHDVGGDTAKDVTTTQTFPPAGQVNAPTTASDAGGGTGGPHALLSSTSTGPNSPGATSYQYDAVGDTTAVTDTSGTSTLNWTPEDELASVTATEASGGTSYVYDADGNQLLRRDPGMTTLTFGADELKLDTSPGGTAAVTGTRTYSLPNGLTAVRQGSALTWQVADAHGTATIALDSTTLAESRRPVDPFGNPRGTLPSVWAGDHGFVGGTQDPATGLTNLGAREYQPLTGRFLNPDEILDAAQPQQWNGYSYSNNDPVNLSDPEGTDPAGTQDDCQYDLSQCHRDKGECNGVNFAPCGSDGTTTVGAPGSGGGLTVGTNQDGQPTLDGVRVPPRKELIARHPERWKDSDAQLLLAWIQEDECGGTTAGVPTLEKFCADAGAGELLPKTLPDPFGITAAIHCISKGHNCGTLAIELVSDALMAVPLLGEADEAALAGRGGAEAAGTAGRESESTVSDLLGEGCRANSFPGSTRVLKDDGTSVPIQSVRVGDTIEATDPLTGVTKAEKVQAVIKTLTDTDFTDLTIAGGVGADPIVTSTQHHPYWDVTRHRWLDAADIHPGDTLRTPNGPAVHVTRVRNYTGHIVTYNLTISELHTYYVLAGATAVLVHNCPTGKLSDPLPRGMNNKIASAYDDVKAGRIPSHDTYGGREHPWWTGAKEYRVPGRPDSDRILEKELPNGVKVYGWTSTHYTKIQRFSAPHFPDSGW